MDVSAIGRDPDVLEVFYRAHIEAISRFVARRVDDPHSAADLTAEVFLAALGSAHTYRGGPGGGRAWLYGVARNVVANDRRRSAREAEAARRVAGRRLVDDDDIARLEERLDAEADARRTYRALRDLPDRDRAVLELVAVDGLGVHEAARVLGMKTTAARVRLHRARRRLTDAMRNDGEADAEPRTATEPTLPTPTPHAEAPA
ncbi:RNA polymerase sigma factor [Yinghuangia sp. ASG 101]|nr:RNA polymerase sigma factor [Yinghuangia sp. ASG 101]UGQ15657.1 RNA polymerase sigma factor [Yinghuangia sp. ASG 101]